MNNSFSKTIGGYFELEIPAAACLYPNALKFQSARAAFHSLLDAGRPSRVWMPKYICDAMLAPLSSVGIEFVFYDLDRRLGVAESVVLEPQDWLLYVNYFGVCTGREEQLLKRFNPAQLVLDHSQAFFVPPPKCLATIYSPRKFFGLPDGGLLITSVPIKEPGEMDSSSVARCSHLLKRLDSSPEAGYSDFKAAEESLWDTTPLRMSNLSERLFSCVDHELIKQRRNTNFHFLHQELQHLNNFDVDLSQVDGPLCYPFLTNSPDLREQLIAERIFISTYWPEVKNRAGGKSTECLMISNCLPLPCDQRYSSSDLIRIINFIMP